MGELATVVGGATTLVTSSINHPLGMAGLAGGVVVVAGDEEMKDRRCWEHVLHIDEAESAPPGFDNNKIDFHRKNGMLLHELARHCEVLKNDAEHLILKNAYGEQ